MSKKVKKAAETETGNVAVAEPAPIPAQVSETVVHVDNGDDVQPGDMLYLTLEQIHVGPNLGRPFNGTVEATGQEAQDMEDFIASIRSKGQLQPVEVRRYAGPEPYDLVFGFRRVEAIARINMELAEGDEPWLVKAVLVEADDNQAFGDAAVENIQRASLSPMNKLGIIQEARKRFGWDGKTGTKRVAEFLNVSEAFVTQHEKLAGLHEDVQAAIHQGKLKMEGAMDIIKNKVKKEDQPAVLKAAAGFQAEEEAKKAATGAMGKGKGAGGRKTGTVQTRNVQKAVDATKPEDERRPLSKKDIVDFFADYIGGPAAPYEEVQEFLVYFVEKFVPGKGSTKTLAAKFNPLIEGGKRTRVKDVEAAAKVVADMQSGKSGTAGKPAPKAKNKK